MNISVGLNFITGIMLGIEHVQFENIHHLVIDLFFIRFIIEFENQESCG